MDKRGSGASMICLLAGLCGLVTTETGRAQEAVRSPRRIDPQALDRNPLNNWEQNGIAFPVTLTTEVLGNLSGGTARRVIWESLLVAGIEVDLEKVAGIPGLSLSLSGLYPQGLSLTDEAVHDFNTLSNIDAYDSVRLYEAWLQQEFWEGKFSVRLGQILADAEFFSSDYGALFINSSFGAIPLVSMNLVPPIFPVAAPGVRLRVAPKESFYAEAAVFSGNVGDPATNNKHNTRLSFRGDDGALVFFEIGYELNAKEAGSGKAGGGDGKQSGRQLSAPPLSGTYKLGGFYDSGEFPESAGGGVTHQGNYSIYFIADQELWHPDGDAGRALSFFTRIGFAPNERNIVPFYFDTGFNYQGMLASRAEDILGVSFSYAQLSRDLVDDAGRRIPAHHEAVLELTYRLALGEHVSLQPDFQCIFNPGALRPAPTAVVTGFRLNIRF